MLVLLGPQRLRPTVGAVVSDLGLRGPLALVTAGWQEREPDDEELAADVGRGAFNLSLYQRAEDLTDAEPELARGMRQRQEQLRRLQELYRYRLDHAMAAWLHIAQWPGEAELVEPERISSLEAVRALDHHHLERVRRLRDGYDAELPRSLRDRLAEERAAVAAEVARAEAVLIAGGHVAGLLNRMRLFDLASALAGKTVIAWSAGAMVVSERIVLFHDSPPQGPGHAEVLDDGLALGRGVLPLPYGRERLHLGDGARVARLAQRFRELCPVLLEPGVRIEHTGGSWRGVSGERWAQAEWLAEAGEVAPFDEVRV